VKPEYIKYLRDHEMDIRQEFDELWEKAGAGPLTPTQAQNTLDRLYDRTHLDILAKLKDYTDYFPTVQCYPGRLLKVQDLWWLDHATAGITEWGTLSWFSSRKVTHLEKCADNATATALAQRRGGKVIEKGGTFFAQWVGLPGACTHFVVAPTGVPFMLLRLFDGAWGEPKRNGDAIQVEMVNALVCHLKEGVWCYWAGKLPPALLAVQRPEALEKPFRGATHMLPYTWEQIITNIKLKRLCIAATMRPDGSKRMARDRMSQHTDWRESKYDMGPLWPKDLCNDAAYETYPIDAYSFMERFVKASEADAVVNLAELKLLEQTAASETDDVDRWDADDTLDSSAEVQQALVDLYGPAILPKYGVDGNLGAESTTATKHFQQDWNKYQPTDRIKVDGVPGTETRKRLVQALHADGFRTTPL